MVKLLQIFSGITFARGHATMHLAFFVGSFVVTHRKNEYNLHAAEYATMKHFYQIRWTHFAVLIMSLLIYWLNMPSKHIQADSDGP